MGAFTNLMKKAGLVEDETKKSPEQKHKEKATAQARLSERAEKNKNTGGALTRFSREAAKLTK